MSKCRLALWQVTFGDIPMPDGCTYEQFLAARDTLWQAHDRKWSVGYLKILKEAKKRHTNPEIIDMLDEQINNELRSLK